MSKNICNYIIGGLFILSGLILFINPFQSVAMLVKFVGVILIITGVLKIIYAFGNKDNILMPGNVFMGGCLNSVFGLVLVFNPTITFKIISIFIGLWLVSSSLTSLVVVLNIKSRDYFTQSLLVKSVLKLILGIIVLCTPIISVIFSGIILGLILILIGVYTIFESKKEEKIYKVRVKKK